MQVEHLGQARTQRLEELADRVELGLPLVEVDVRRLVVLLTCGMSSPGRVEVARLGHPAEGRLLPADPEARAVHDPLEHAHVVAVARPEELALLALPEPVDQEHLRRVHHLRLHRQPVTEVGADVVAAEGQHREGVAAHDACLARGGRHGLAAERGPEEDAVHPVKGLHDERDGGRAAASEDDGLDRDALGVVR